MVSPNKFKGPPLPLLIRQDSLNNEGKPLNTMNFDMFIQNPSSSTSSSSPPIFLGNSNFNGTCNSNLADDPSVQTQVNLGDTTLEDFLVNSGVISPQPLMEIDPTVLMKQRPDWLQFQVGPQLSGPMQAVVESNFRVSEMGFENPGVEGGCEDSQVALPVASSADCKGGGERKRRFSEEMMEKSIERRHRRMIKNRESAARSRARKQAYTNQLEHEVLQLRRTNSWLKKQKEVEAILCSHASSVPRYQLRRTSSAAF